MNMACSATSGPKTTHAVSAHDREIKALYTIYFVNTQARQWVAEWHVKRRDVQGQNPLGHGAYGQNMCVFGPVHISTRGTV